jgi:radical SAM superfamily enzyme YgiQ (UPF0313 family)
VEQTEAAVAYLQENGIIVMGGFILGNPDDTEADFWTNEQYAKRLKLDGPFFFALTPYPKTILRQELLAQNLIINLHDYSWYHPSKANVRTHHLTPEEIDQLLLRLYRRYFDWRYFRITNIRRHYPLYFFLHIVVPKLLIEIRRRVLSLFRPLDIYQDLMARRQRWLLDTDLGIGMTELVECRKEDENYAKESKDLCSCHSDGDRSFLSRARSRSGRKRKYGWRRR